ncbi:MAG: endo-1,4-beta-xylanase [Paludibacteraceae bacterium]|nr:endo-1,4-beta-xylanase [Paludibacteraceae bacterium]
MKRFYLLNIMLLLTLGCANAQLAKDNSCKFLGNITTSYNWQEYCDPQECNRKYTDYWNQVTCENATKWGSVHSGWGRFNWSNADRTYNYCKEHGIIFKYHALIWGSQHPSWIESLSVADTKKAIIEWFDEVKKHYPDLAIIDVVNEAIYSGGNYHSPYKQTKIIEALGSLAEDRAERETGRRPSYNCNTNGYPNTNSYQWLAEAFRLARDRWPDAILIYNDYNTFQWQKTEFINLVNGIKACGGPIDAAGNQAHDLNDMGGSQFKNALEEIHNKTQLPQYITEYDIAKSDDATFETRYKEQFPIMWEADYVAGVTLWGWIYGKTWVTNGCSGLVRDCKDRSAFTWLQQYMKTDAAKNAKSPICLGKKSGISSTLKVSEESVQVGETVTISVSATARNGSVRKIDIYAGNELLTSSNNNNCEYQFTASQEGTIVIKSISYDSEGNSDEKTTSIFVCKALEPYNGSAIVIPGVIEVEEFDKGCPGIAYYDTDDKDEGDAKFRTDGGVDIVKGNNGYAIGYTAKGEWLNYTIDVKEAGSYKLEAYVSSGNSSSSFSVSCGNSSVDINVPMLKENSWDEYSIVEKEITLYDEGIQNLRIDITNPYCNIDKIKISCSNCTNGIEEAVAVENIGTFKVYTTYGTYVGEITIDSPSEMSSAVYNLTNQAGVYILINAETSVSQLCVSKK